MIITPEFSPEKYVEYGHIVLGLAEGGLRAHCFHLGSGTFSLLQKGVLDDNKRSRATCVFYLPIYNPIR